MHVFLDDFTIYTAPYAVLALVTVHQVLGPGWRQDPRARRVVIAMGLVLVGAVGGNFVADLLPQMYQPLFQEEGWDPLHLDVAFTVALFSFAALQAFGIGLLVKASLRSRKA